MDRQNLSFLQDKPYKVINIAMNFEQEEINVYLCRCLGRLMVLVT